ncbi:cell adhesion molecule 2-like [Misgurnus anguillicaudatus]|uniref:cell adhesion molecule 2-like n=1 Tax=Misgurnus anguillicaudatus TaxID=75329 RepID=UPI003CCF6C9E
MQTRALVYNASLRINERRRQTFKVTLCRFFTCFLYLSWVSQVEGNDDCHFLTLNPSSVVVEYGSSVSVDCSTDVTHEGMGWEAAVGFVHMTKDKLITWRVSNLTKWDIRPQCYINYNRTQCSIFLPITVYKTPDSVSINTVNHTGPMIEGSQYELQCDIMNVAPCKNLTVKWFKEETEVKTETFDNTTKSSVTATSTLNITANRSDNKAQYRCEAELELGADGPQPPPKVTSEPFKITVYFKPAINETKLPSTVSVIRGYPVQLVCEAEGNPPPKISWSNGNSSILKTSNGILTLDKVSDEAFYTCTADNIVNRTIRIVKVVITENYVPIIVGIIVAIVVVILIIIIFIYIIYYKKQ